MSQSKPLYGVGARVMVVSPGGVMEHKNTVVMSVKWIGLGAPVINPETNSIHPGAVPDWWYEVSADPGSWYRQPYIRPRPEPGASWESIKDSINVSPEVPV